MGSPLVSVIIPSYNHAAFVEQTIDSVIGQTLTDLELIIIDDGSTDDSVERIQRKVVQADARKRVRFIPRENRGLCQTLNEGLVMSRGIYFAYLGSDDLWAPEKLQKQLCAIEKEGKNTGASFTDCYIINSHGERQDRFGRQYDFHGGNIYHDLVRSKFHPPSPTNLFVRRKLILAGGFPESIPIEDRDTWLRIARYYRVAYIPEPLASFRVHASNTSMTYPQKMLRANEHTFDWAFRTDPELTLRRRMIKGYLHAGLAAAYYNALDLSRSRREALRSIQVYPFNLLGWRIILCSLLGANAIEKLRATRSRTRNFGGALR